MLNDSLVFCVTQKLEEASQTRILLIHLGFLCILLAFKKKNCMSNERLLWGQEPLIFQAFSCFPKDFTLSFLLFSIILKSFNFVLNQTLFVVLVDSSLRKLDRILD